MSWDGSHTGQENTDEIVISDAAWFDLTPFYHDDASSFISLALMDTLIYYDADMTPWPHLATNWTHISDTQLRVKLREGIKWQPDYEGNFTNEYFDTEDVYFSYTFRDRIVGPSCEPWYDHMEIVDDYTIDFFIDGDSSEPGAQPSSLYLQSFERFKLFVSEVLFRHISSLTTRNVVSICLLLSFLVLLSRVYGILYIVRNMMTLLPGLKLIVMLMIRCGWN